MILRFVVALAFGVCLSGRADAQMTAQDLKRAIEQSATKQISNSPGVPSQTAISKIIFQEGLAPIVTGRTSSGVPIGYRFVLLAEIPGNLSVADEQKIREKAGPLVASVALQLRTELDKLLGFEEPTAKSVKPGEDFAKHFAEYAGASQKRATELVTEASLSFGKQFSRSLPLFASKGRLAIVLRPCAPPTCSLTEFAKKSRNRSTDRFGKLYGWMKSKGLGATNQAYILDSQGVPSPIPAKLDKGYEWHDDFSKPALQAAFVNAAKHARLTGQSISYSVPELTGLPRETTAHLSDVFDSAYAAAQNLPSNSQFVLQGISDEIGRTRLIECVRLRGTFDPNSAGRCAGYNIKSAETVAKCLGGGPCMPDFGDRINMDSVAIYARTSLSYIAVNANLPRVNLGSIEQLETVVNRCANVSGEDAKYCVIKNDPRLLPAAATLKCIENANGQMGAVTACAKAALPPEQQKQFVCFQKNSKNYRALALCASEAQLPPAARNIIGCANSAGTTTGAMVQTAQCLGLKGAKEVACLQEHQGDWQAAALCAAGDKLPPQVQSAMECAKSQSLTSFGVCMVAKEGSGEAQRIAACYAETQGVPAAMAVCLASEKLTEDQRIVLECAAQTNGALPATAACIGGKEVMKTMSNCHGKKFGEGSCFGESNEIRKFAKNIGLPIGPNSVIADMVNLQLQVADATLTPILESGSQVLGEVLKFATNNGLVPDPNNPRDLILGPTGTAIIRISKNPGKTINDLNEGLKKVAETATEKAEDTAKKVICLGLCK
jgi:hypothetical protein